MSKKGENIYKRKDGRWEARYIKGYLPNGKAKYGYCYGKTYAEAKEKVIAWKVFAANNDLGLPSQRQLHFSGFCDEWLQLKRSTVKSSTYIKYQTAIENHIKPHFGKMKPEALSSVLVEQFSYDLLHTKHLSSKTVKDILTVLRGIISYTKSQTQFLSTVEIVYPKEEKKEMRVLSREEQHTFMEYLIKDMDYCKFGTLLTLLTGMRIGEVCSLRWKDISLEDETIKITSTMQRIKDTDTKSGQKTKIYISKPKTLSSGRLIPLSPFAIKLCRQFYGDADAYILTNKTDRYMEPRALQYRMKQYVNECQLDGVHFHTLRHSFATRCVEVGFELKSLSEILGHANSRITLERYVHSSMELKRENMKKLAAIGY